jgi:hypothetical protein
MNIPNRETMIQALTRAVCVVEFEKVNGDMRKMHCTLNEVLLPTIQEDKMQAGGFTPKKQVNEKILAVWDINAAGWRSFRVDSVKNFEVTKVDLPVINENAYTTVD